MTKNETTEFAHGTSELGKSRSQKKRDSTALQKLGEALCSLSSAALAELSLSADLEQAIRELWVTKKHEARRRQNQLIGRYMRDLDESEQERLALFIASRDKQLQTDSSNFHLLEAWREALLDAEQREATLAEISAACPTAELKKLRHMAETAAAERNNGKGVKFYRELFRYLKSLQ